MLKKNIRLQDVHKNSAGLLEAIAAAGSLRKLADKLGISHQSIAQWLVYGVPADRIVEIERVTGVERERLRPDLYRIPHHGQRR